MRASIIGGLLSVAVLAVGCGGAEVGIEETPELGQSEAAVLSYVCGVQNYDVTFYAEPERINVVGTGYCLCGSSLEVTGTKTNHYVKRNTPNCTVFP
ncbi:hypothetical protein HPC49_04690 [Pyxidicoccus fallax]|uniref:Lipoprotein n=1 Tax=Pyxidicoccus fallax TaxID=394095 RepID=A0A848LJQ8_9BACT|nr:hypothetical protein [Pyxidicoccus fallax]NMO17987.1 hypothetical protein [Pyxidicoccus fallax]NPC77548.1 hypothetical protein [Pyxidicoccus fallax]